MQARLCGFHQWRDWSRIICDTHLRIAMPFHTFLIVSFLLNLLSFWACIITLLLLCKRVAEAKLT